MAKPSAAINPAIKNNLFISKSSVKLVIRFVCASETFIASCSLP